MGKVDFYVVCVLPSAWRKKKKLCVPESSPHNVLIRHPPPQSHIHRHAPQWLVLDTLVWLYVWKKLIWRRQINSLPVTWLFCLQCSLSVIRFISSSMLYAFKLIRYCNILIYAIICCTCMTKWCICHQPKWPKSFRQECA